MSVRIGFSTSKTSWVSRIIRWFTNSSVSHCFIVYWDNEWSRFMKMESEGGLGGSVRLAPFNAESPSIVRLFTPRYSVEAGMLKMVDRLGDVYDYKGLFGMAWVEVGRWLKRKWRNPLNDSRALFCSELVVQVLIDSNYPGANVLNPGDIDPQMLMDFFETESELDGSV